MRDNDDQPDRPHVSRKAIQVAQRVIREQASVEECRRGKSEIEKILAELRKDRARA